MAHDEIASLNGLFFLMHNLITRIMLLNILTIYVHPIDKLHLQLMFLTATTVHGMCSLRCRCSQILFYYSVPTVHGMCSPRYRCSQILFYYSAPTVHGMCSTRCRCSQILFYYSVPTVHGMCSPGAGVHRSCSTI